MKNFFILIIFLSFQSIYSQRDFRNGYIITVKGDTIKGLIDYRQGALKFEFCDFKKSKNHDVLIYDPAKLKGYGFFNDAYFESKKLKLKGKEKLADKFVEILVKGRATFYKYKALYFLELKNTSHELENKEERVFIKSNEFIKYSNRYIGTLIYALNDCSELKNKIKKTPFSEKSLTKLIELYNGCFKETSITYKRNKKWFKANFALSIVVSSSSMNLKPDIPKRENNISGNFNTDISVFPGFNFDLFSPRLNENISFHGGVYYSENSFSLFETFNQTFVTYINDVTIELKQIKIPLGFRYTFPKRSITPYFSIGLSNNILLSSNTMWGIDRKRDNVISLLEGYDIDFQKNLVGYWGGVGVKKNVISNLSLFLGVRYESLSATAYIVEGARTNYNVQNFQILAGINF